MAGFRGQGMATYMRIMASQRQDGVEFRVEPKRKPNQATMKFIKEQKEARQKKITNK